MIVLDTNVVSELIRPKPAARVLRWIDDQDTAQLAITAITLAELLHGVARLPDGARKVELTTAVQTVGQEEFEGRILPFDAVAAESYAQLVAQRERTGHPISVADGQIAAICHSHGATLATRNTRDFRGAGIRVLDPWQQ